MKSFREFMLPILIGVIIAIVGMCIFGVPDVYSAEPVAKVAASVPADVQPVPNVATSNTSAEPVADEDTFGKRRMQQKDEGLKKLLVEVPQPNVFTGFRILMWGLTIAGCLLGLFFAFVIVVVTLRFLRKTAVPAAVGVVGGPASIVGAGSLALLQVLDHAQKKLQERRDELAAEQAEIDARLGINTKGK